MTTNKPEVVAWMWEDFIRRITKRYDVALELSEPPFPVEVEPLIRLSDYEGLQADHQRLQAGCKQLRQLVVECAEYLNFSEYTSIHHGSCLHRRLIDAAITGESK